jgi:hypothetical protein
MFFVLAIMCTTCLGHTAAFTRIYDTAARLMNLELKVNGLLRIEGNTAGNYWIPQSCSLTAQNFLRKGMSWESGEVGAGRLSSKYCPVMLATSGEVAR